MKWGGGHDGFLQWVGKWGDRRLIPRTFCYSCYDAWLEMIVRETGVAWTWFVLQVTDIIIGFGSGHIKVIACAMVIDVLCLAVAFYVYKLTTGKFIKHAKYKESTSHMFAYIAELSTKLLFDELMMPSLPKTEGTGSAEKGQEVRRHSLRRYSIHSVHTAVSGSVVGSGHLSQAASQESPGLGLRMSALQRPTPLHSTVSHISGGPRRPSGGGLGKLGAGRTSTGIRSPGLHGNIKIKHMNVQSAAMKWKSRKVFKPKLGGLGAASPFKPSVTGPSIPADPSKPADPSIPAEPSKPASDTTVKE